MAPTHASEFNGRRIYKALISLYCPDCQQVHQVELRTSNPVHTEQVSKVIAQHTVKNGALGLILSYEVLD